VVFGLSGCAQNPNPIAPSAQTDDGGSFAPGRASSPGANSVLGASGAPGNPGEAGGADGSVSPDGADVPATPDAPATPDGAVVPDAGGSAPSLSAPRPEHGAPVAPAVPDARRPAAVKGPPRAVQPPIGRAQPPVGRAQPPAKGANQPHPAGPVGPGAGYRTVSYQGIRLTVPHDWTVRGGEYGCVGRQPLAANCSAMRLYRKANLGPQGRIVGPGLGGFDLDSGTGWAINQTTCAFPGASAADAAARPKASRLVKRDHTALADGRKALYREWEITCASGKKFTAMAWYLPFNKLLVYVPPAASVDREAYARVVSGMNLAGYRG
jgi:hypothetical protein